MQNPNLRLNVLTFAWPQAPTVFYFSESHTPKCKKLYYTQYPNNIELLFPGITADKKRSLYTTFDYKSNNGKPLRIDFSEGNLHLLKRFYNNRIHNYFRDLSQLVKVDFVKDNQIWLLRPELSTSDWEVYEKYTLKIQFCQVSQFPELVVSYSGLSKILKQTLAELIENTDPECFGWIYHEHKLQKYSNLIEHDFTDFATARPVLNYLLGKALGMPVEIPKTSNGYKTHLQKITSFIKTWLNTTRFVEAVPLHNGEMLSPVPNSISHTHPDSNLLLFGNNKTSRIPYQGMANFGPYQAPKWGKIHLFYIFHEDDVKLATEFHKLIYEGSVNYKGLGRFANVNIHTVKNFSIVFTNRNYPVTETEATLRDRVIKPDVRYIAIYLTSWGKDEHHPERRKAYPHMKELLLKYNITMQCVEVETLKKKNSYFHYSLTNMAVAMLAKLNGIPWLLNTPTKNELIIGVGAFRQYDTKLQYIGSAFSFDNTGSFNSFKYFMKHETKLLAGSIAHAVRQFASNNQNIERLIIHFYKTMSEKELQPIEEALHNLGLDIPVFIVSINKTEAKDIVAFDTDYADLMPLSGTYINIGRNRYLLFNNTRYNDVPQKISDGFPFPVKLTIDSTQKELLNETHITDELIEQVYQFSRLYYKSVRQQPLPITIKYPEILARIAPNFRDECMPAAGEKSLWFL